MDGKLIVEYVSFYFIVFNLSFLTPYQKELSKLFYSDKESGNLIHYLNLATFDETSKIKECIGEIMRLKFKEQITNDSNLLFFESLLVSDIVCSLSVKNFSDSIKNLKPNPVNNASVAVMKHIESVLLSFKYAVILFFVIIDFKFFHN